MDFPKSGSSPWPGDDVSRSSPSTTTNPPGEAHDLLGRAVQGAHQTIDRMAESAAPRVQKLQEGMASASETLQARAQQMRTQGDEATESLRNVVREHPLCAVATALVLGALLGRVSQH